MVAIVSVETLLLVLLLVLVAGLLRSHAEILRRLESGESRSATAPGEPRPATAPGVPAPDAPARPPGAPAAPITGPTPDGDLISVDFSARGATPTLLAFLSTGCTTCAGFWETLGEPRLPRGVETLVVTHGQERERPRKVRELAPDGLPVVMSSEAWRDYSVPASPYFVLVDGAIRGEGSAASWSALGSLVSDALEDLEGSGGTERAAAVDRKLAAAGVGPDHPSLYPAGRSGASAPS
jgi:hypothetical protein